MRATACGVITLGLAVLTAGAQIRPVPPWIRQGGAVNDASRMPVTLPGGALAPGALVSIDGMRFVPGETTVEVEAGKGVWSAQILEATTEHILARLPDVRISGVAKLFVTARGSRSVGTDIVMRPSAFGIYTANHQGWGPLAGDGVQADGTLQITGTGLGRVSARAIDVWVGNRKATIVRRDSRAGRDRLTLKLPTGLTGCTIPLTVVVNGVPGNTAAFGECTDERYRADGTRRASLVLARSEIVLELDPGKPVPFTIDAFTAGFDQRPVDQPATLFELIPAQGTCMNWAGLATEDTLVLPSLVTQSVAGRDLDLGPEIRDRTNPLRDLDAGAAITISGPLGSLRAERSVNKPRVYTTILGGNPPLTRFQPIPLFLFPGTYRISIPGGPDVGAADIAMEVPEMVRWRERETTVRVSRAQGVQFSWTAPAGYRAIVIVSNIDRRNSLAGFVVCRPEPGAVSFQVPARVLANMPATDVSPSAMSLGFAGVIGIPVDPRPVKVPGTDRAEALFLSLSGRSVIVQ